MDSDAQQARSLPKDLSAAGKGCPGTDLRHHVQRLLDPSLSRRASGANPSEKLHCLSDDCEECPLYEDTAMTEISSLEFESVETSKATGGDDTLWRQAISICMDSDQSSWAWEHVCKSQEEQEYEAGSVLNEPYPLQGVCNIVADAHDTNSEFCDESSALQRCTNDKTASAIQSLCDSDQESTLSNIFSEALSSCNNKLKDHVLETTKTAGQDAFVLGRRWKKGLMLPEAADLRRKSSIHHAKRKTRGQQLDRTSCKPDFYAQNRRERVSRRLKILKELIPNGTKSDLATMLETTVKYVEFLELRVKALSPNDQLWAFRISGRQNANMEFEKVDEDVDGSISNNQSDVTDSDSAI